MVHVPLFQNGSSGDGTYCPYSVPNSNFIGNRYGCNDGNASLRGITLYDIQRLGLDNRVGFGSNHRRQYDYVSVAHDETNGWHQGNQRSHRLIASESFARSRVMFF